MGLDQATLCRTLPKHGLCRSLPKNVERADFFRYMVILKHGGVYADMDTECRRPLRDVIQPQDTMVVGWENEFATLEIARARCAGLVLLRLPCCANAACAECRWLLSALSHPHQTMGFACRGYLRA